MRSIKWNLFISRHADYRVAVVLKPDPYMWVNSSSLVLSCTFGDIFVKELNTYLENIKIRISYARSGIEISWQKITFLCVINTGRLRYLSSPSVAILILVFGSSTLSNHTAFLGKCNWQSPSSYRTISLWCFPYATIQQAWKLKWFSQKTFSTVLVKTRI